MYTQTDILQEEANSASERRALVLAFSFGALLCSKYPRNRADCHSSQESSYLSMGVNLFFPPQSNHSRDSDTYNILQGAPGSRCRVATGCWRPNLHR